MVPPVAGATDVGAVAVLPTVVSEVEEVEQPASEAKTIEAMSVLRSTQKTLGAGSPVASTGCEWVLISF